MTRSSKVRYGGCGEVVNTAGCGPVMRGFDPHRPPHIDKQISSRRFFLFKSKKVVVTAK